MEKIPVLVIAGPTASGKTDLAVEIAKKYNGEVISADSMQIYKWMDIGTAKPTEEEMGGVPHHMIDIIEPFDNYSVALYVEKVHGIIEDIIGRGKLPIVAGGTGLYINSLIDDVEFSEEKSDPEIRKKLEDIAKNEGRERLMEMLADCDPISYEKIHPNNLKRVIRAIEFFELTGEPISAQTEKSKQKESRYEPLMLMIARPREYLYERIEKRVDIMLRVGLVEEVEKLKDMGLTKKHLSMQGIGYKEVLDYLRGFTTGDEMIRIIKRDTRHYAKRQLTWFNRDKRMIRIDGDLFKEACAVIDSWKR